MSKIIRICFGFALPRSVIGCKTRTTFSAKGKQYQNQSQIHKLHARIFPRFVPVACTWFNDTQLKIALKKFSLPTLLFSFAFSNVINYFFTSNTLTFKKSTEAQATSTQSPSSSSAGSLTTVNMSLHGRNKTACEKKDITHS